jgi:hypothetical protein
MLVKNKKWIPATGFLLLIVVVPWYSLMNIEWAIVPITLGATFLLLKKMDSYQEIGEG